LQEQNGEQLSLSVSVWCPVALTTFASACFPPNAIAPSLQGMQLQMSTKMDNKKAVIFIIAKITENGIIYF
jgi:hypothetical protein